MWKANEKRLGIGPQCRKTGLGVRLGRTRIAPMGARLPNNHLAPTDYLGEDIVVTWQVAEKLGSRLEEEADGLLVLRKTEPTPAGFPRRPGMAKKRPLA